MVVVLCYTGRTAWSELGNGIYFLVSNKISNIVKRKYILLTMLAWSRWLDLLVEFFFFFACLWTEKESRSTTRKKRTRAISSYLVQTSLVNIGFVMSKKKPLFSCGTQRVISSGQDRAIFPIE